MLGRVNDPLGPYGELLDTSVRVLTWNLWWRFGPWRQRHDAIAAVLAEAQPVCRST